MKQLLTLTFSLLLATSLFAKGPWNEYAESTIEEGSAVATALAYVINANESDFDACRAQMTEDYEAWLERLGGVENSLEAFVDADLEKRFAWREIVEDSKHTVWVRIYVTSRERETNIALNLISTDDGWKLTK